MLKKQPPLQPGWCQLLLGQTLPSFNKLCTWRHNMPLPLCSPPMGAQVPCALPRRHNVAVLSHVEYVPTLTAAAALCVKAALSKAARWPWPLTLKVVSESRVTWAISVPILVFLGFSVLDLGPMYVTDRRQTKAALNAPLIRGGAY